ncbi:MAG: Adenylate cyclase (EC [uncultured Paraburkholderia sp.]|nr:MAG: Adenylate cyclase (EC [uncultured Paraburkholderia sp.]
MRPIGDRENGEARVAERSRPRDDAAPHTSNAGARKTPRVKAQSVLSLELAKQRHAVNRMRATHSEAAQLVAILRELLGDPAFVALMTTRGFTTVPRLLHERLTRRPR